MNVGVLAVIALTRIVEGAPPPKGPDRTRLCIENATDELVGAWIWHGLNPFASRVIASATTDCMTLKGYSQTFNVFIGKGERDIPGTAVLFPDRVHTKMGAICPSYEGGQLRFKVIKSGDHYQCQDAR